jgi:hypothetical protein
MPTTPRKAKCLLREGKAKIVSYQPFTIQLTYATGETIQPISIGVDLGAKYTGIAVTSEDKVLVKGEMEVRQDVKSLLDKKRIYRRSRRNRKTRYRKPRFNNRKRQENWLPPSIQSRINNTFFWIDKFLSLVPNPILTIEVGKFDIQKMMNSNIEGEEYQQGQTYGYYDVRYFVFARDNYTCQVCKKQNKILQTHHIVYRSHGGSDRADNLITICTDCHTHKNHQEGNILWRWMMEGKKVPTYREGTFMNIFRQRIFSKYPQANITYGSVTTPRRKELGLEKSHANDAIAIAGVEKITKMESSTFKIKQFRKKKRSLHESTARKGRKTKNTESKRNVKNVKQLKGFYLNDKVRVHGKIGYITGFTGASMAYVKDIYGIYITNPNKSYKQVNLKDCEFVSHNNNWQYVENF